MKTKKFCKERKMTTKSKQNKATIQKKIISVSRKRQITIPLEFCKKVGIGQDIECYTVNNSIILRPIVEHTSVEFAEQILADLISMGFSGDELLKQFKIKSKQIRPAIGQLLEEADEVAMGEAEYSSYEDVFSTKSR
jgi:bifunctional DNA-binding transcriptional regulator/antitoxin component of YhaV-PrlF toxin-antitoxin module